MNNDKYNDIVKRSEKYAEKYSGNTLMSADQSGIAAEAYRKGACDEYQLFEKQYYNISVNDLSLAFRILPTDMVKFRDNEFFLYRIVNHIPVSALTDGRPLLPSTITNETEILFEYNFSVKKWYIKSIK